MPHYRYAIHADIDPGENFDPTDFMYRMANAIQRAKDEGALTPEDDTDTGVYGISLYQTE